MKDLIRKLLHWLVEVIFKDGKKKTKDKEVKGNRGNFPKGNQRKEK